MQHVFIIGSKGIPANYGGFETFVDELTKNKKSDQITYHVACMSDSNEEFEYNHAHCFKIKIMNLGPARAVLYDILAVRYCLDYIKKKKIENAYIYILACRIGPFIGHLKKQLKRLGATLYVNPDGNEWRRSKWSKPIKMYWKFSERLMVKHAELLICDSLNIEKYILESYAKFQPKTTFIAYGAELENTNCYGKDEKVAEMYQKWGVQQGEYYLVVGRFVSENNYETIIREFMASKTKKSLILITNTNDQKFYHKLKEKTGFDRDSRIKFVGTVYDRELLKKIRRNAYGYLHGHEVGGTNPSLLEALAMTRINLLLNVPFNAEVAEDSAIYWTKEPGDLARVIEAADMLDPVQIKELDQRSTDRIRSKYSWDRIVNQYETLFLEHKFIR